MTLVQIRRLPTLFLLLGVATFASCWTPQHDADTWPGMALARSRVEVDNVGEVTIARGPTAAMWTKLGGRENATPVDGDVVVYSIDVETPGESYRRFIRFTVNAWPDGVQISQNATITMTSPTLGRTERVLRSRIDPVKIELFDEELELLSESLSADAPVDLLAKGFADACRAHLAAKGTEVSAEDARRISMLDSPALFSLAHLLESDDTLYDVAFDLVDWTLALTAIWNFGVDFTIEPSLHLAEAMAADPVVRTPAWRFPLQFKVNDRPALRAAVTVVDPVAPLGLTAGITRVDGFRPTDDRYRFRIRLVTEANE